MIFTRLAIVAVLGLATSACTAQTLSDPEDIWQLVSLNGAPFEARATLSMASDGRVTGQAPCNRYFGTAETDGVRIAFGPIGATRMACAELSAESAFFEALAEVDTLSRAHGELRLNGPSGEMVFKPAP